VLRASEEKQIAPERVHIRGEASRLHLYGACDGCSVFGHAHSPAVSPITCVFTGGHQGWQRTGRTQPERLPTSGVQLQRTDQGRDVLDGFDPLDLSLQISHPPTLQA
jgi:hypothetical protein